MLKMSTRRRASVLAIFTIFCVNILTKSDKRFIISLQMNIGIFRNTALRCGAKHRETGCKSPTQKRHCEGADVLSVWRKCAGHSKKIGEGFAERDSGNTPHSTKSGYSVPTSAFGFPKGASMQCIKMFAPKFEKNFGAFLLQDPAKGVPPSFFTE